jgi:ferredoxin-type protein NapF
MTAMITRRALFDRLRGGVTALRPPWAIEEAAFTDRCHGCGDCIEACPVGLLAVGRGNLPIVDFAKGACTFCGACADACSKRCFVRDRAGVRPWGLTVRISAACIETRGVACRMCEAACDALAIRFRPRVGGGSAVSIDQENCSGCGACLGACPAGALAIAQSQVAEV